MSENQQFYRFSDSELKALVLFFRQNLPVPDELYSFNAFAEKYVYSNLSIGEAEQLYGGQ